MLRFRGLCHLTKANRIKTSSSPNHLLITNRVYSLKLTVMTTSVMNIEFTMSKALPRVTGCS